MDFSGDSGHGGGALAADDDHAAVHLFQPGTQYPPYPQQFVGQFAVAVLHGDDEFTPFTDLQFLQQSRADQRVAAGQGTDVLLGRQFLPEWVDRRFGRRVDPHQHDPAALPTRLRQSRQVDPRQRLPHAAQRGDPVGEPRFGEAQLFIAAFHVIAAIDGNVSRTGPHAAVDHLGVDPEGEVVKGLQQKQAEAHGRQGNKSAATVAPEIFPGQLQGFHATPRGSLRSVAGEPPVGPESSRRPAKPAAGRRPEWSRCPPRRRRSTGAIWSRRRR